MPIKSTPDKEDIQIQIAIREVCVSEVFDCIAFLI